MALAMGLFVLTLSCQLQARNEALELAKAIPQYPGSTYQSSFQTTYPDDTPGSGVNYLSGDSPGDILEFFEQEVSQHGWTVAQISDDADEAVPKQLILARPGWTCTIHIWNEEPRRINIKVEGK